MKKAFALGAALALVLALAACGTFRGAPDKAERTPQTADGSAALTAGDGAEAPEPEGETEQEQETLFVEKFEGVYVVETTPAWDSHSGGTEVGTLERGAFLPRLAVGVGAAEGWSQVGFNNAAGYVYVPNEYLSTKEPAPEAPQEEELFDPVSETVYATTTVNVRDTYSADGNRLDSLSRGEAVTRTGTGTGAAEGWSRIAWDGSTAYVSSDYLSATKPQNDRPSGGQTPGDQGGSGGQGGGQTGNDTTPAGSSNPFGEPADLTGGRTPEEIQQGIEDSYNTLAPLDAIRG